MRSDLDREGCGGTGQQGAGLLGGECAVGAVLSGWYGRTLCSPGGVDGAENGGGRWLGCRRRLSGGVGGLAGQVRGGRSSEAVELLARCR
ncbi:hypothetical protein ACX9NJ_27705 [Mycobacterium sp. ML2]